jgi:flagellar basal-body rod modification protein FlgD
MTVAAIPDSLVNALNGSAGAASSKTAEMQDRFLKLLVTQIRNQDPLNPLDNAQFTSQLAQLSTVDGINKINETLQTLNQSYLAGQSMLASGMIGHSVLAAGDSIALSGGLAGGGIELGGPADAVMVNILDGAGQTVRSLDLGAQSGGLVEFVWDGMDSGGQQLADGVYRMSVMATQAGDAVSAMPLTLAQVGSVSINGSSVQLHTNLLGELGFEAVKRIY